MLGVVVVSLFSSVSHIMELLRMKTNNHFSLASDVVVKYKIFSVNKSSCTVTTAKQVYILDGWKNFLSNTIFNPSVFKFEKDYLDVRSTCKYKLDSKIKERHENSEASKHHSETKIFPMQSSHTMSCVIATNPVQVTHRGVGGGDRNGVS